MDIKLPVSKKILALVGRMDHFRGFWGAGPGIPPERLVSLRDSARTQSAASASRLAGIRVADEEAAAILRDEACPLGEASQVLGYARALDRSGRDEGPLLTTERIRGLHAVLMGSPGDPPDLSPWREVPLQPEAFDGGRATGRVFQTLPPRLLPGTMEDLTTWLELELRTRAQHPLLVIGGFMLAFLAAGPFPRGNSRMALLLVTQLLQREGYRHLPYASLEREMEDMREAFYEAWDAGETRLWTGEADLVPWVTFFLEALDRHRLRVEAKLGLERRALEFSPLQRAILEIIRERGTAGAALLMEATGVNRNTLKDNLRRLVECGILERMGERRGSLYRLAGGPAPPEEV